MQNLFDLLEFLAEALKWSESINTTQIMFVSTYQFDLKQCQIVDSR